MNRIEKGKQAEAAAFSYLEARGYQIIQRNYSTPLGEIDLIAEKDGVLIFTEVRSRQGTNYGLPQETVNKRKQQKIRKVAALYIKQNRLWKCDCRFDVIGVVFISSQYDEIQSIEHIEDAF